MLHTSTDMFTPVRPRRHHGGGGSTIDLVIGILQDGRVLVVALPGAKLGAMRDILTDWEQQGQFLFGNFCPACARKYLAQIKRPYGWHARADDGRMVVLETAVQRRAVLDRLVAHVH
jgi:hypothetical protein